MEQLLDTYLQDHHAGAVAGVDAFERVATGHGDESVRREVAGIAQEIREDREALEQIMAAVGATPSRLKDAAGSLGEKVSQLKPNQRIASRSPLSDLVELEALVAAVHAKMLGWVTLLHLGDDRIDAARIQQLVDRADDQQARLERLRLGQVHKLHQS